MIDSGAVGLAIWDLVLSVKEKDLVKPFFGARSDEEARGSFGWFVSMHDVGKISPGFEGKVEDLAFCLRNGYERNKYANPATDDHDKSTDHGLGTLDFFCHVLAKGHPNKKNIIIMGRMLAEHHGLFKLYDDDTTRRWFGTGKWDEARRFHCEMMGLLFAAPDLNRLSRPSPAQVALLCGLVAECDWVSSNKEDFGFYCEGDAEVVTTEADAERRFREYHEESKKRARSVVESLGIIPPPIPAKKKTFEELFGFVPYEYQLLLGEELKKFDKPTLTIVELPTGDGKTEMVFWAMYQTDNLRSYTGLPTQAMSNAQLDRTKRFFASAYGKNVSVGLAHSRANYITSSEPDKGLEKESNLIHDFFTGRKTTPFWPQCIGTMDQMALGVLKCKHNLTRLAAFSGKAIVLDEIHAYDSYMDEEVTTEIGYLRELGCSIFLMSATLPTKKKMEYLRAFKRSKDFPDPVIEDRFPSVVIYDGEAQPTVLDVETEKREVILRPVHTAGAKDASPLLSKVDEDFSHGGCLAVLRTIMSDVQSTYRTLVDRYGSDNVVNFHARHLTFSRRRMEERLLSELGLEAYRLGKRPERLIVVASPLLGECLNISFDRFYGDFAPIDIMIQRLGRVLRFVRQLKKENRSELLHEFFSKEIIYHYLLPPNLVDGRDWGSAAKVYFPYLLDTTLAAIINKETIRIPEDCKELVNAVYSGDVHEQKQKFLNDRFAEYQKAEGTKRIRAAGNAIVPCDSLNATEILVGAAGHNKGICNFTDDDDENFPSTRNIEYVSVPVICACRKDNHIFVGEEWSVDLGTESEVIAHGYDFWKNHLEDVREVEAKLPIYFKNALKFLPIPIWKSVLGYKGYTTNKNDDHGLCLFVTSGESKRCNNVIIDDSGIWMQTKLNP